MRNQNKTFGVLRYWKVAVRTEIEENHRGDVLERGFRTFHFDEESAMQQFWHYANRNCVCSLVLQSATDQKVIAYTIINSKGKLEIHGS